MADEQILVVDDEPAVREIVMAVLGRHGYTPFAAAGAEEALELLSQNPGYSLVLSDVMMPEVDGLTLLDLLGQYHPGLPVVLCTAVHDVQAATSAFRRGAVDYLLKPFDRTQLLGVVDRALEHGRLERQRAQYWQNLEEVAAARTERLRVTMQDLERSYDTTLEAMGDALDLRDAETEGHSKRVTAYTIALAQAMGLGTDELRVIARGAFLHDLGKIAIPDSILLKPGKLDAEETEIMRRHCERGYEMVRKIPFLREASEIVYSHQESFNGSGYPRGLRGVDIPLGARIFAIADTLDAITSDRPYRAGRSFAEARAEIEGCSGRQFDPVIVEVFLRMPPETWSELRAKVNCMPVTEVSATLCRPTLVA